MAGYVVRQFTCSKDVTHPTTNHAQCRATALIETNALPLTKPPKRKDLQNKPIFRIEKYSLRQLVSAAGVGMETRWAEVRCLKGRQRRLG